MKKHVLLIDDDNDEVEILCTALRSAAIDHKCTWVQSVRHALLVIEHLQPDVIFIDFNMPGINGVDGIGMIRQMDYGAAIPIVLYSNTINPESQETAMRLGAKACIQKPSTVELLASQLTCFFNQGESTCNNTQTGTDDLNQPIAELAVSDGFKREASNHGFTHLRQLLDIPIVALQKMSWMSEEAISELAEIVRQARKQIHA
jgi:CheY-like chemotaxis protein